MNHLISGDIIAATILLCSACNHVSAPRPERVLQTYLCVQQMRKLNDRIEHRHENKKCKSEFNYSLPSLAILSTLMTSYDLPSDYFLNNSLVSGFPRNYVTVLSLGLVRRSTNCATNEDWNGLRKPPFSDGL